MSKHLRAYFKSKINNKPNLYNTEKIKILYFEFFRNLKCVTKRECVTSRVRKDVRGYCTSNMNLLANNINKIDIF